MKNNMIFKTIAVGITIILICLNFIPSSGGFSTDYFQPLSSDGNILYVGGVGPDNYTSIQLAINDANEGDTVFVFDDSSPYYENVIIDKSISLIGENRETTIVDGRDLDSVIIVQANNVIINGFKLINCKTEWFSTYEYNVITVIGQQNLIIKNNYISIYNVEYVPSIAGIYLEATSNSLIQDNIIFENKEIGKGIALRENSNFNNISGNEIYNERLEAISILDSDNIQIYKNYIHDNEEGISIGGGRYIEIIENSIINNEDSPIYCGSCNDVIISKNVLKNNVDTGVYDCHAIELGWVIDAIVTENIIADNENGIYLVGGYSDDFPTATNTEFVRNEISNNSGNGFTIQDAYSNTIKNNNFRGNGKNLDIYMWRPTVYKNTIFGNYWDRPRLGPKFMFGISVFFQIPLPLPWGPFYVDFPLPWLYVDWRPAILPYDIGG